MDRFEAYLDQVTADLVQAWRTTQAARKSFRLTLRHALRFTIWQSLNSARLKDKQIAKLVQSWLGGIDQAGSD